MNVLELFAGIGGLSLGPERAGMRVVGQVEIDPFCRAVLAKHWPEVDRHDDVRTAVRWRRSKPRPRVHLVAGRFPCQPVSDAGLERGTEDPRWLWPAFLAVVLALRPDWVSLYLSSSVVDRGSGFANAGRAEAEAVLLGCFVVELDLVAGFQGAEAVHFDRAEVDLRVAARRQVGRGDRSPSLLGFEKLDGAVCHVGSMADTCRRGNRVRVPGGRGVAGRREGSACGV
ncbi:hypothetical protein JOF41_000933 [Saccharothrix coeruleofusca]|uniref:DNA cytosine methyltransferase n=1 Tax=Saccharothrix coeruleofusca TaxID=33919 RepID=UPI003834DA1A|nr:hypothetical protein [Saccharothrix coeruleofusca]